MASVSVGRGRCCLFKCIQGDLEPDMARVEVRSFRVKDEDRKHMEIEWSESGDAVFHDICWKAILDSLRMENPFSLSSMEKEVVTEAKKTAEYFDSTDKLNSEVEHIVKLLSNASYAIAFTGAGISTAAGISDFRGKCGAWTLRDRYKQYGAAGVPVRPTAQLFSYESMIPSYTHEALQHLIRVGILKHIISQNVDSLHRLSGVPRDRLSELHGNIFHERCEKCGARYERPFHVSKSDPGGTTPAPPTRRCIHCHAVHHTGRSCERKGCDGLLVNTIINFGDSLEKRVLSTAEDHAKRSDLVLCLGSSLLVTPACDLIEMGKQPVRLVVCNRQPTPFDRSCYQLDKDGAAIGSRVFGDCDVLMRKLMKRLLSEEELQDWESSREARLAEYAKQRQLL